MYRNKYNIQNTKKINKKNTNNLIETYAKDIITSIKSNTNDEQKYNFKSQKL